MGDWWRFMSDFEAQVGNGERSYTARPTDPRRGSSHGRPSIAGKWVDAPPFRGFPRPPFPVDKTSKQASWFPSSCFGSSRTSGDDMPDSAFVQPKTPRHVSLAFALGTWVYLEVNKRATLQAAEQGNASAQFNLGVRYANGRGVPKDVIEAAKWYRLATEQDHPKAQFNLGAMYARGWGVLQDAAEATKWYRKAAEQGHAEAQWRLGLYYTRRFGGKYDPVQAYAWFSIAAAQGHTRAAENRDEIKSKLRCQRHGEMSRFRQDKMSHFLHVKRLQPGLLPRSSLALPLLHRDTEHPRLALGLEPVALALDVDRCRVV